MARPSHSLGELCIWGWPPQYVPRCIPGYTWEGAGEQLRQPEGVWPGSHVAFRAHLSSPWLTPPDILFVCLRLPPSNLLSRELREQEGMKSGIVLCWLQAVCVCVCVTVFQWLSFLYSSAIQLCRHRGLGMSCWSQEHRTCFNQRHTYHLSHHRSLSTHTEHACTTSVLWFAAKKLFSWRQKFNYIIVTRTLTVLFTE